MKRTIKVTLQTKPVAIHTPWIRLDDLLKFAAAVSSGGQAKAVIGAGRVTVNGAVCTMRGKKTVPGDRIGFDGVVYEVTADDGDGISRSAFS